MVFTQISLIEVIFLLLYDQLRAMLYRTSLKRVSTILQRDRGIQTSIVMTARTTCRLIVKSVC